VFSGRIYRVGIIRFVDVAAGEFSVLSFERRDRDREEKKPQDPGSRLRRAWGNLR
jgi:hypothetical protein